MTMSKKDKPKGLCIISFVGVTKNYIRNILESLNCDLIDIRYHMERNTGFLGEEFDEIHFYVMALEDRRFCRHHGVDLKAILREILKFLCGKKYSGASTIDMQMVRTITNYKEKTFKRKLYEIYLSILVNFKYTKKQIINCYLENAFFGSGITGISEASYKIFGKVKIEDLSKKEKAQLAAMLQKPRPINPKNNWQERLNNRALYAESVRSRVKSFD